MILRYVGVLCAMLCLGFQSTVFVSGGGGAPVDLTSNLELYLTFNSTLNDSSPNNLHGTHSGTPTYVSGPPGGPGNALQCDGVNERVTDNTSGVIDGLGILTLSVFVNVQTANLRTGANRILTLGSSYLRMQLNGSTEDVQISSNNGNQWANTVNNVITNGWNHFIIERPANGNGVAVWIDNVAQTMDTTSSGTPISNGSTYSVCADEGGANALQADVCGLRLYSRTLTPAQRAALFNGKCP